MCLLTMSVHEIQACEDICMTLCEDSLKTTILSLVFYWGILLRISPIHIPGGSEYRPGRFCSTLICLSLVAILYILAEAVIT